MEGSDSSSPSKTLFRSSQHHHHFDFKRVQHKNDYVQIFLVAASIFFKYNVQFYILHFFFFVIQWIMLPITKTAMQFVFSTMNLVITFQTLAAS